MCRKNTTIFVCFDWLYRLQHILLFRFYGSLHRFFQVFREHSFRSDKLGFILPEPGDNKALRGEDRAEKTFRIIFLLRKIVKE
jgi:hypothetical protein